jgi:putative nucleotide binding protein
MYEKAERDKEEYAIVLDFLPNGNATERPGHRRQPVAQALGKNRFTLLELVPREGVFLQPNEEVYIGEGKREKVHHVNGRIPIEQLTNTARGELQFLIEDTVKKNETKYLEWFNKAQPLSIRLHKLELLPGFGKKHLAEFLDNRDEHGDFASFEDMRKRVKLMPDPEKLIIRRILSELEGKEKHRIFTD